jgi:hypothetical protein
MSFMLRGYLRYKAHSNKLPRKTYAALLFPDEHRNMDNIHSSTNRIAWDSWTHDSYSHKQFYTSWV